MYHTIFINSGLRLCLKTPLHVASSSHQQGILLISRKVSIMSRKHRHGNKQFEGMQAQKRLRVLVDMDQVLCDFEGSFLEKFKERYPDDPHVPLEERNTFYIADQYKVLRKDLEQKARNIWETERFFLNLLPISGACEAVTEMSQMEDVDVFICTSPLTFYKYCLQEKFKWVEDHLGAEWINKLVIAKDKSVVNGDILIDDRPRIHGKCQPTWKHIVFSAPYNLDVDLNGRHRLDSWTDGRWRDLIEDYKKRIG